MSTIDLRPLKKFISERFPKQSYVRGVILAELDDILLESFLEKLDVWLKLAELEAKNA